MARPDNIERNKLCRKNLVGQKFGRLLVLEEDGRNNQNASTYRCKCDCGNIKEKALSYYLLRGSLISCGCFTRERLAKRNNENRKFLNGQKFGKLQVLEEDGKDIHGFTYTCKCECGKTKNKVSTNDLNRGSVKSCGCLLYEQGTLEKTKEKLLKNIKIANDCWEWQGYVSDSGYGSVKSKQKTFIAHRLAYEIFKGQIEKGRLVLHICDNRRCINPDHLYLGDYKQNMKDMVERNRCNQSPLKKEDVLEIRNLWPKLTMKKLGALFNVSANCIAKIIHRKTWSHV